MNPEQALKVIEEALNLATTKGAFNLAETNQIVNALMTLKSLIESNQFEVTPKEQAPIKELKKELCSSTGS